MAARGEITKKFAREYQRASKKQRGVLLDGLCQATGWSRDNARRAIRNAFVRRGGAWQVVRKARGRKYSYDVLKILIEVWTLIGEPCGKYFAAIMEDSLTLLRRHGELKRVAARLSDTV